MNLAPTAPVRINPDLPGELERIINKALEKDRDLRYRSAADLATDLKRMKRDSDSNKSVAMEAGMTRIQQRPQIRWWVLSVAFALLLIGVGTSLYLYPERDGGADKSTVGPLPMLPSYDH